MKTQGIKELLHCKKKQSGQTFSQFYEKRKGTIGTVEIQKVINNYFANPYSNCVTQKKLYNKLYNSDFKIHMNYSN